MNRVTAAGGTTNSPGTVVVLYTYQEGINTYSQQVTPETTTYEILSGGDFATVDSSTGALTIEENRTTAAREVVVQVTAEYTPSSSATLAASATCTVTQDAGSLVVTYDVPEVTLQYNDITYNAKQVLPTYSYRQHWSDNAGDEGYIEMGDADDTAEILFSKVTNSSHKSNFDLDGETGEVDNITENTSSSSVTVGDITLTVEMNGMIGTATASFQQYANTEVEVFTLRNGLLYIRYDGTSLAASDINLLVTLEFWGLYDSGASGIEAVINYYSDDPLTITSFDEANTLTPSPDTYTQLPSEHITYAGVSIYDYAFKLRDKKITYSLTFHYGNDESFTRSGTIYCTGDYDVDKDEVPWTTDERDQTDANLRFEGTTEMYPELYINISD